MPFTEFYLNKYFITHFRYIIIESYVRKKIQPRKVAMFKIKFLKCDISEEIKQNDKL